MTEGENSVLLADFIKSEMLIIVLQIDPASI